MGLEVYQSRKCLRGAQLRIVSHVSAMRRTVVVVVFLGAEIPFCSRKESKAFANLPLLLLTHTTTSAPVGGHWNPAFQPAWARLSGV